MLQKVKDFYMPITLVIQAYYSNEITAHEMCHRDHCLQQTLDVVAQGAGVKPKVSEFSNSDNHVAHHDQMKLFVDPRDTALSISSDGAQLTMKKESSLVKGARPAKEKGAKAQYYPISPPQKERFNPHCDIVDLDFLPMRSQSHYWETIERLQYAATKKACQIIVKETGISRLTLCAASPAFHHPSFFPLDPFHLFYENCMVHIWDLWMSPSSINEKIHMDMETASLLGEEIEKAVQTLPSSFCGPIRNPYKKRHSQYKIYEWMALLHWYIIPIAWELDFDIDVLRNFAQFVDIVEVAMSHSPKSDEDLVSLHNLIKSFLQGFERLYVGDNPDKVSRCRLCIWQLIHIPHHIEWNGSIRFGSQATV
jgi:hypothetical protein